MIRFDYKRLMKYISYTMFFLVVISSVFCVFTYTRGINPYDTWDFSEGVFWAEATIKAKSIINPEYSYYYFLPFGSNLIMIPFVLLYGTTLLANQLGMLPYLAILIFVLYKLSSILYKDSIHRILFITVSMMFAYTYAGDNTLHHLLNYGIGYVCFIGELAYLIDIIENKNTKTGNYIALGLFVLWASSNGLASIFLSTLPIIVSLLIICLFKCDSENNGYWKQYLTLIVLVVFVLATGFLIYKYFDLKVVTLHQQNARYVFDDIEKIVDNGIRDILVDYFCVFFFNPADTPFFSVKGLLEFTKLFFALMSVAIPIIYIWRNVKNRLFSRQIIIVSSLIIILVCLSQYILSRESVQRYLFNMIFSQFILCALWVVDEIKNNRSFLILPVIGMLILLLSFKQIVFSYRNGENNKNDILEIVEVLKENKLHYGYTYTPSLYWKQFDMLSNNEIYSLPIGFTVENGTFYIDIDSKRYYVQDLKKPSNCSKYFVMVSDIHLNDKMIPELEDLLKNNIETINVDGGIIYVFDINNWDKMFKER